jgi:hypothetical protein
MAKQIKVIVIRRERGISYIAPVIESRVGSSELSGNKMKEL